MDVDSEGEYACTARNAFGLDAIVYSVQLLRVPEAPLVSVVATTTSSISLSWNTVASVGCFFFFLRRFPCNVLKQKSIFSPVARRGAHRLLPADAGRAGTPIRAANGRRLPGRRRPAALALWQSGGSRPPRKTLPIRSLKSDWCVGLSDSKRQPHSMQHESNVSNVEPVRSAGASAQPHRNGAQEPRAARRDPRRRSGDARPGASLQVPDSFFFVVLPIDCVLEWAMLDIQFYSNVTSRDCLAI